VRNFFKTAAFLDFLLVLYLYSDPKALLNTQVAFISSLLIVLGSFWGYKRAVEKGVQNPAHRDYIDTVEDRFDLYGEDEVTDDAKELFESEKKRIKGNSNLKVLAKSYRGFFSPLRLFGYLFMVVAILMLIKRSLFEPLYFLLGLAVVPLSAMVTALISKRE